MATVVLQAPPAGWVLSRSSQLVLLLYCWLAMPSPTRAIPTCHQGLAKSWHSAPAGQPAWLEPRRLDSSWRQTWRLHRKHLQEKQGFKLADLWQLVIFLYSTEYTIMIIYDQNCQKLLDPQVNQNIPDLFALLHIKLLHSG